MLNRSSSWSSIFRRAFINTTAQFRGICLLSFVSVFLSSRVVLAEPPSELLPSFPSPEDVVVETIEEAIAKNGFARVIIGLQENEGDSQPNALIEEETPVAKTDKIDRVQKKFIRILKEKVADSSAGNKASVRAAIVLEEQVEVLFTEFPLVVMEVNSFLLEVVQDIPLVVSIELDGVFYSTLSDSIPLIGADQAWQNGHTGGCQAVAVLDTGVDKEHPDLNGKVIAEACFSRNSASTNSLCPNGLNSEIGPDTASYQCGIEDRCVHGTHVAGIAAANGNVEGVAKGANLVAIQVFHQNEAGQLRAFFSDVILALQQVLQLHQQGKAIAAVNMSLGGYEYDSVCDDSFSSMKIAIDELRAVGIASIVSSGNDSFTNALSAPACISSAISVGATWKSDVVASFSNSASFLDLLAPGVFINSTTPGGNHDIFNGTSMAAPHVAGAWAVLKAAKPTATVNDIFSALQTTGVPILDTRNNITKPRIQVNDALARLGPQINDVLYGVHDEGLNESHFFTIDPSNNFQVTGLPEVCPNCDIEGLDLHPQTCELYASAGDDTKKPGHLYLVNKGTGGLTDLGSTGFDEVDALSFNPTTGVLWGWAQDGGLLRFDNLPLDPSATLVWAPPKEWEVEDLTWNTTGTTLYGVKNLHGNHDPDSHGPLDQELGVELLAYETTLESVCQSLVESIEIEALDTLDMLSKADGKDWLIVGIHGRNKLNLGLLNVDICEIEVDKEIDTPYDDVEGIAWPSSQ